MDKDEETLTILADPDLHPLNAVCSNCGMTWGTHIGLGCVRGKTKFAELPLYDADPKCEHEIVELWSGYRCEHCTGWYCA